MIARLIGRKKKIGEMEGRDGRGGGDGMGANGMGPALRYTHLSSPTLQMFVMAHPSNDPPLSLPTRPHCLLE